MSQVSTKGYLTIKEASEKYGLSTVWIRRMVHQNQLEVIRVKVGDTNVERIEILETSIATRASGSKSRRDDGRNKFVLYATPEEYETLTALLAEHKLETPIARANPPKSKKEKTRDDRAADLDALKESLGES